MFLRTKRIKFEETLIKMKLKVKRGRGNIII